jgi:DNA-binding beta-propeller fold protein YncE
MKRMLIGVVVAAGLAWGAFGGSLVAQSSSPEIAFDSNADFIRTPFDIHVGEVGGVGVNSKGQIYIYTRTGHGYATIGDNRTFYRGGSRLFQFDPSGKYIRELGQDVYGFNAAYGLRVDPQDNVWTIDIGANQVVKFDTEGRVALVLGRKPETISVRQGQPSPGPVAVIGSGVAPGAGAPAPIAAPAGRGGPEGRGGAPDGRGGAAAAAGGRGGAPAGGGGGGGGGRGGQQGAPGSGTPGSSFSRPTDVAWDKQGNIYVADGIGNNNRIAKFDKDGRFIRHWGSTGNGNGQFNGIEALVLDAQGNVYAADVGNKRIQVFDGDGNFKTQFGNVGTPIAMCITRGATQHLFIAHAGDPDGMEDGAIYQTTLDGKVVGKFGRAGKLPKEFGVANSLDCRSDTELLVGEMTNWRVQRITLKK